MYINYSDLKPFKLNYVDLPQIAYFYWMYEYVLEHFYSDDFSIEFIRDVPSYGVHWGGNFIWVKNGDDFKKLYVHTGLVYLPSTEVGIYFEAESWKNTRYYKTLRENLAPSDQYDINKEETEFVKAFFPKAKLDALMNATLDGQIEMLNTFFMSCAKAFLSAIGD